jgi:hypothetical protein
LSAVSKPTGYHKQFCKKGFLLIGGFDTCTPWHRPPGQVCVLVQVYALRNERFGLLNHRLVLKIKNEKIFFFYLSSFFHLLSM